jgi:dUTP pyrophosphatase
MSLMVKVTRIAGSDIDIGLPSYETAGSAGMDLRANFQESDRGGITLAPMARGLVPTGLKIAIPDGFEAQIRPRSGLALKHGVTLANTPGTIDSDYRGPLGVILINLGSETFHVAHGDRIGQIIFAPVIQTDWSVQDDLDATVRGEGGFGSTGKS